MNINTKSIMRKISLTTLSFFFVLAAINAQDLSGLTGKKALKQATKLLTEYNLNQTDNADKLQEALPYIDHASKQDDIKDDVKVWRTKGEIYNAISTAELSKKVLDPNYMVQNTDAGVKAYEAFKQALSLKAGDSKSLDGLAGAISSISELGYSSYEAQDYKTAYGAFMNVVEIHDLLKENSASSPLDAEGELSNQKYVTGLAALSAQMYPEAKAAFMPLYEEKYEKAGVYDALHKIAMAEGDTTGAGDFLSEGRERFPDDLGMLYGEINYYLQLGAVDKLSDKLQLAIEKEPENPSLHSTLGNVYDKLYQEASNSGDEAMAAEHFENALKYYNDALAVDDKFTSAIYSIGALYYNKAAIATQELNVLADDYSKEGTKKYEEKKVEVDEIFKVALPYFQDVEKLDPSDRNTLIALKEIYARNGEFEVSNEFKTRLEKLEAGETIPASYFNR